MALPYANRSRSTRLISLPKGLCGTRRRKLVRRYKTPDQSRALAISDSRPEPIAVRRGRRQSALEIDNQPKEQTENREMFLQAIVEACASNVAVLDELGNILYVSKSSRPPAEKSGPQVGNHPLDLRYLERLSGPKNGRSDQRSALAEDIQAILDGKVTEFHNEYLCPSPLGSSRFLVHAARLDLPGSDGAFRVLVNSSNITRARQTEETLRVLGGRLITAQEEERSRVARELHDDLNQRMALLSVELEQLSLRLPPSQKNLRASLNNVRERAQEISSEIHRVSYQLHPSKLDHLGLIAAVRSHCMEVSARHEIKIAFKEKGCSGLLPNDVTLCLFRIVQEALRNAIKHSAAREVTVALAGTPDGIELSVSDNGRGFDMSSLESKSGLGLISMRERLRLVGGLISVQSSARGTKIEVSVPLNGSGNRSLEIPLAVTGKVSYLHPLSLNAGNKSAATGKIRPKSSMPGHEMRKERLR
ncbi:MAG TPA: sensor histidine kinase [Pyrinomonadaceae bacterium]|nr:sensor histidine kinase [Pyrinomonadaceae bacterium]